MERRIPVKRKTLSSLQWKFSSRNEERVGCRNADTKIRWPWAVPDKQAAQASDFAYVPFDEARFEFETHQFSTRKDAERNDHTGCAVPAAGT
ncbi:MAG: hypothetical protein IPL32_16000 [Chloracidobacterium sp.]|nr:hypothetical protein [Chloracidobacterium sp.]